MPDLQEKGRLKLAQEENVGLVTEDTLREHAAPKARPLDYVMVRHLGYSPETKTHRAARPGQHRQRLMLDSGRKLRFKGERFTEVAFKDFYDNFNTLLASVRSGTAEVCRPDTLRPFTVGQLLDLGKRVAADYDANLKVDKTLLEPLFADLTDTQVWVEKPEAGAESADTLEVGGPSESQPEEPLQEAEETGLLSAVPAQLEEEESLTEEDLHKKSRNELNELAETLGIEDPEKLPNKQAVIDEIIACSEAQE